MLKPNGLGGLRGESNDLVRARRGSGGLFRLGSRDRQLLGLLVVGVLHDGKASLLSNDLGYERFHVVGNGNSAGSGSCADFHACLR